MVNGTGRLSPALALLVAAWPSGCQVSTMDVAAGEYVSVHWDPQSRQLCGGTIAHIEASLEVVAGVYDVPLPERPSIDIFWLDADVSSDWCGADARACGRALANGATIIVLSDLLHQHELVHAVRITGSTRVMPAFLAEGVAVRWEPGVSDERVGRSNYVGELDYELVVDLLAETNLDAAYYDDAGFLWAWLEGQYGPEVMASFAARLPRTPTISEIEQSFEAAAAVSLEQAVEASRGAPMPMFDVLPCAMPGLTPLSWDPNGLAISEAPAHCSDTDIVNFATWAARFVRVELPEALQPYTLELGGEGYVRVDRCAGPGARPHEDELEYSGSDLAPSVWLGGNYVFTMVGPLDADGHVEFPRVELTGV